MDYRHGTTTEKKSLILILILFFNLILMSTKVILKDGESLFQTITGSIFSPVQILLQKSIDFASHELTHYVFLKNMFQKYHQLKTQHRDLKFRNYLLRKRLSELEFQRNVIENRVGYLAAESIAVDHNFPYDAITINQGSFHGIRKDMVVLNEDCQLVGRVIPPIYLFSAKVRLITSAIGGVGASIHSNGAEGLVTGSNQKTCQFKYLLENIPVIKGDTVITSGTDGLFPAGLPIGHVISVHKEYLTQEIRIKPYFIEKPIKRLLVMTLSAAKPAGEIPDP